MTQLWTTPHKVLTISAKNLSEIWNSRSLFVVVYIFRPTEVTFSGSTGLSTPLRRASLPVSPRRTRASFATNNNNNNNESDKVNISGADSEEVAGGSTRRASFVSKATVFIDSSSNETRSPQRTSSSRHSPVAANFTQQAEYRAEGMIYPNLLTFEL